MALAPPHPAPSYSLTRCLTATQLRALPSHQDVFAFNVIDTSGTIEECERTIHSELKYQSSLELASETHATLSTCPCNGVDTRLLSVSLYRSLTHMRCAPPLLQQPTFRRSLI